MPQSKKVLKSSEMINEEAGIQTTFKPKKGKFAGKEPRRMFMQAFSPVKKPQRKNAAEKSQGGKKLASKNATKTESEKPWPTKEGLDNEEDRQAYLEVLEQEKLAERK